VSEENLELAREGYEAWNRDDLGWFIENMSEDAEMRPIRAAFDFDEVYYGHEGWTLAHRFTFRDGKLAGITVMTPQAAGRRFEPRG
jgi:hypothetical protein